MGKKNYKSDVRFTNSFPSPWFAVINYVFWREAFQIEFMNFFLL